MCCWHALKNLCESFLRTQEIYDMINEDVHVSTKGKSFFISVCVSLCLCMLRWTQAGESSFISLRKLDTALTVFIFFLYLLWRFETLAVSCHSIGWARLLVYCQTAALWFAFQIRVQIPITTHSPVVPYLKSCRSFCCPHPQ